MIETIEHDGEELALIIRRDYHESGIRFFTPGHYSQQVGYMNRPAGYVIPPHVHKPVSRVVHHTNEVLLVKTGRLRVDFYTKNRDYLQSAVLERGDVVLLIAGGHGFEMLEPVEMIEVKQGPYAGDEDKIIFEPPHDVAVITPGKGQ